MKMDSSVGWKVISSNVKPSKLHITVQRGRSHKTAFTTMSVYTYFWKMPKKCLPI